MVIGTIGVLATIFLGAISNGVWEYILKPILNSSSDFVLNLISFGIRQYKDQIYLEIAKNFHEDISISLLSLITAMLMAAITMLSFLILLSEYIKKHIDRKFGDAYDGKKKIYYKIFVCFFLIFSISFIQGDFMRIKYINRSITKYNQLLNATIPYMDQDEINKIESSFALIKNKSDYDIIIKKLIEITEENNIDVKQLK